MNISIQLAWYIDNVLNYTTSIILTKIDKGNLIVDSKTNQWLQLMRKENAVLQSDTNAWNPHNPCWLETYYDS